MSGENSQPMAVPASLFDPKPIHASEQPVASARLLDVHYLVVREHDFHVLVHVDRFLPKINNHCCPEDELRIPCSQLS
jgi:hypothetical protein